MSLILLLRENSQLSMTSSGQRLTLSLLLCGLCVKFYSEHWIHFILFNPKNLIRTKYPCVPGVTDELLLFVAQPGFKLSM